MSDPYGFTIGHDRPFGPWVWPGRVALAAVVLAALLLVERLLNAHIINDYYQEIVITAGISVILAVSLNLINGITGQFSLGHAGFMAVGGYVSAYFTKVVGQSLLDPINFGIGIALGAVAAGVAGLLVGLPSLRLRGDYLAIVTLGFNQIIISLIRNIKAVGDASGFSGINKFTTFAWTYALAIGCVLCVRNLADSGLGRSMRAVRDDEIAAEAVGIATTRVKVLAFVISAMWAGVAGALYVHFLQLAHPNDFTFMKSVEVVVMVVLGGLGSITGSVLAAVGLQVLAEVLREPTGVFWSGLIFLAVATWWSLPRHRRAMQSGARGWLEWLAVPWCFLLLLATLHWYAPIVAHLNPMLEAHGQGRFDLPPDWIETNKGSLRYIIYALILIVIMLVRPQGLMGRNEWSLRWRRRQPTESRTSS